MAEALVFLVGSIGFIILSRRAFTRPYSHGFPRFFAFEALLGLVVLDAHAWFLNPFSFPQIISWALLLLAVYLAIHSFWTFRAYGATSRVSQDASRIGFENTTRLVTKGPYRLIRHPMYTSLICLAWGTFLKQPDLQSGLLALIASLTLFLTAVYEERENLYRFGDSYGEYMRHSKRFIPFVF